MNEKHSFTLILETKQQQQKNTFNILNETSETFDLWLIDNAQAMRASDAWANKQNEIVKQNKNQPHGKLLCAAAICGTKPVFFVRIEQLYIAQILRAFRCYSPSVLQSAYSIDE